MFKHKFMKYVYSNAHKCISDTFLLLFCIVTAVFLSPTSFFSVCVGVSFDLKYTKWLLFRFIFFCIRDILSMRSSRNRLYEMISALCSRKTCKVKMATPRMEPMEISNKQQRQPAHECWAVWQFNVMCANFCLVAALLTFAADNDNVFFCCGCCSEWHDSKVAIFQAKMCHSLFAISIKTMKWTVYCFS